MKINRMILAALCLGIASTARTQTADDYVAWGRASLAGTNIAAAKSAFAYAVVLSPNHQEANALCGATRLLALPGQPAVSNFMSRLGLPAAGRDIYNWTAEPPRDRRGDPVVPDAVNGSELTALLRTNILTEFIAAEANLAKVTDTNFTLHLTADETRVAAVTLDYGDIQVLRAMLKAAEYGIYTVNSWNVDAQAGAIHSLVTNEQLTLERLLRDFPNLMTFATTNDLNAAKAALQAGADRYQAASRFIRQRPSDLTRLFNLNPEEADNEEDFRATLVELTNSFNSPVTLSLESNYTVFLGAHFSGAHSPRSFLPQVIGDGFVLGTLPDPTFGGAIAGLPAADIETFLAEMFQPIPSIAPVFSQDSGQFGFPLNVLNGRGYLVQVSRDLTDWWDFGAFVGTSNVHLFSDPYAASYPSGFYRIVDCTEEMPPPLNDDYADRIALSGMGITTTGYNANASTEPGEPGYPWSSVWWSWTAPVSGTVVITTEGSSSEQWAQIYTNGLAGLGFVAYDGQPFQAVSGTTYQIQVCGGWEPPGGIRLTITAPPEVMLTDPDFWEATAPTNILISAIASDADGSISRMEVYVDEELLGYSHSSEISLTWSNVPLGYHYIDVKATDNLGVSTWAWGDGVEVTPHNDDFANRLSFSGTSASVTGTNLYASREPYEPNHAGVVGYSSIWWSWLAPSNGTTVISTWLYDEWGLMGPSLLGVYTGNSIVSLTPVASNEGMPATVSFNATGGTTYQIAVDGRYAGARVFMRLIQPQSFSVLVPTAIVTNRSGAAGSTACFLCTIPPVGSDPEETPYLEISIAGGTGDCDLYVRSNSPPTLDEWDYRPYLEGNEESVVVENPPPGDYYIMLHGYDSYSGVSLLVDYYTVWDW